MTDTEKKRFITVTTLIRGGKIEDLAGQELKPIAGLSREQVITMLEWMSAMTDTTVRVHHVKVMEDGSAESHHWEMDPEGFGE